jgi:hypothetical protein
MLVRKGADPELFLVNNEGKFMSSVGLIGGTKEMPMPIDEVGNAVQEDNVAVEFNIPPCHSKEMFVENIKKNKEWIAAKATELGFSVSITPSAHFEDDQLATREAQTFGCEPDFNAWNDGHVNPRPKASDLNLRSCGGHIHVELPVGVDRLLAVQCMDLYVGCLMLEFDNDKDRRQLYGKAGAFRPKRYGMEYRTASNKWIESDELIAWAWDQTDKAIERAALGVPFTDAQAAMIQNCINNSDLELLQILKEEFAL